MKKMIHLTRVFPDSHTSIFMQKVPFTRKPGITVKIVLDPKKIITMSEGSHKNFMNVNEDFPVLTTLTMYNRSRIDVAESVEVIEGL